MNGSRTTGYPYGKKKKKNLNPYLTVYTELTQKGLQI